MVCGGSRTFVLCTAFACLVIGIQLVILSSFISSPGLRSRPAIDSNSGANVMLEPSPGIYKPVEVPKQVHSVPRTAGGSLPSAFLRAYERDNMASQPKSRMALSAAERAAGYHQQSQNYETRPADRIDNVWADHAVANEQYPDASNQPRQQKPSISALESGSEKSIPASGNNIRYPYHASGLLPRLDRRLFDLGTGSGPAGRARADTSAKWTEAPAVGLGGTGAVARLSLPPLLDWRKQHPADSSVKSRMKGARRGVSAAIAAGGIRPGTGPEAEAGAARYSGSAGGVPWGDAQDGAVRGYCRSFFGPGYTKRSTYFRSRALVRLHGPDVDDGLAHRPTKGALGLAYRGASDAVDRGAVHLDRGTGALHGAAVALPSLFECVTNTEVASTFCAGTNLVLNPSKAVANRGGEPVSQVMGQDEGREWVKYNPGTATMLFPGTIGEAKSQLGRANEHEDPGTGAARAAEHAAQAVTTGASSGSAGASGAFAAGSGGTGALHDGGDDMVLRPHAMGEIISLQKDLLTQLAVATGGSEKLGGLPVTSAEGSTGEGGGVVEAQCTAVLDFAFVLGRTEYANPYHQSCDHNQAFVGNRIVPYMFSWLVDWVDDRLAQLSKGDEAAARLEHARLQQIREQLLRGDAPQADLIIADAHPESGMDQVWQQIFRRVFFLKHLPDRLCVRHVVFLPVAYRAPAERAISPRRMCPSDPYMREFGMWFAARMGHAVLGNKGRPLGYSSEGVTSAPETRHDALAAAAGASLVPAGVTSADTPATGIIPSLREVAASTTCSAESGGTVRVLFVRREDYVAHPRSNGKIVHRIENEPQVEAGLRSMAESLSKELGANIEVESGFFSRTQWVDQVSMVRRACVIVGAHGAGLSHILWARPGTKLIEVLPPAFRRPHFWAFSLWAGSPYRPINTPTSTAPPGTVAKVVEQAIRAGWDV